MFWAMIATMIVTAPPQKMRLVKVIQGNINPKSVVHSGYGLFFAQNMTYLHTVTVFNRDFQRVKTIPDTVRLSDLGYPTFHGAFRGGPVEAAFSHDGRTAWVSNYQMYGPGFSHPGNDKCAGSGRHDPSFVYRINTNSFKIEAAAMVGSVPKYLAVTPDDRLLLVSNWCSYDLSVVDTATSRQKRRIRLGRFPRGIAISPDSSTAYVALVGAVDVAVVDLRTFKVGWIRKVGRSPRHLCLDRAGRYLYATLNGEGKVAKIDVAIRKPVKAVATGKKPRSAVLSGDSRYLYVVNNGSDTLSKIETGSMRVVETVKTRQHPIGVAYDDLTRRVWVACYRGNLMVFQD